MVKAKDNGEGHNITAGLDTEALKRYVDLVLQLLDERDELNASIKQVYDGAKAAGFVTKIIRKVVAEARLDGDARQAQYDLMDQYRTALGLFASTPLGEAAVHRAGQPL